MSPFTKGRAANGANNRQIPTHLPTTSLVVTNMHCPSCVDAITQLLADVPAVKNLSVSLLLNRITFSVDTGLAKRASTVSQVVQQVKDVLLAEGGFETTEEAESSKPQIQLKPSTSWFGTRQVSKEEQRALERHARHLERCEACRAEQEAKDKGIAPPTLPMAPPADQVMDTVLSIDGMTCASCTSAITDALTAHSSVLSAEIALVSSSGKIRHKASLPASEVAEIVSDIGYDAEVVESHPESAPSKPTAVEPAGDALVRTTFSIEGMTCSSCSSAIMRGLDIDGVVDSNIDVLGNKGVITHKASLAQEAIKDIIEDIGYDAEVISSVPVQEPKKKTDIPGLRTVTVRVDGMFCNNCISQIKAKLESMPVKSFTPINLKNPVTTITYEPHEPLTIRDILAALAGVAPEFDAELVRPMSLSERSQAIQHREVKLLASHLVVAFLFAIPTFIIAIVSMVLLKRTSKFRMYWMEPVWGGADRGTVALFPLATIVQFGVGRLFYQRTLNSLWPHIRAVIPSALLPKSMKRLPARPASWRSLITFGSMDLLVVLSTTTSYFASVAMMILDIKATPGTMSVGTYYDASVFLIMFILLGRTLEAYAKSRTTDAVTLLGSLRPATAWLVTGEDEKVSETMEKSDSRSSADIKELHHTPNGTPNGSGPAKEIPIDSLEYGDLILIQPGALPPADGTIVAGSTTFDESSLTGEALPVPKTVGDEIFTGTTNQSAAITVRVTNLASDTMLERIIRAVSDASGRKAPLEKAAERLTGVFVPIVVYISIAVLALWLGLTFGGVINPKYYHGTGGRAFFAIEFAVSVLVVACPCGIGLAVPCANAVGNGLAAAAGILAAGGGEAFTAATKVTTIAFDKTGTLTIGKSVVTGHHEHKVEGLENGAILRALRDVEAGSTHPLAVGLVDYLNQALTSVKDETVSIIESSEIAGRGVRAMVSVGPTTLEMLVGNAALLSENGLELSAEDNERVHTWASDAKSVVLVAARRAGMGGVDVTPFALAAAYALSDPPRPTTKAVLTTLQERGYRVVMLSGDNPTTAKAVARTVGIKPEDVHAGVGPEGKAEAIAEMQAVPHYRKRFLRSAVKENSVVMFVGDGLNDAVALAAADVSAAMGHGSQATLASADFVLLSSTLDSLLTLLSLSRKVYRRQWINLGWATVFNTVCIPIAAGILFPANGTRLSPVWSAVLMALSSFSVVMSSLALRWYL